MHQILVYTFNNIVGSKRTFELYNILNFALSGKPGDEYEATEPKAIRKRKLGTLKAAEKDYDAELACIGSLRIPTQIYL